MIFALFGLLAGALTTVAGIGGGMVLVLALALTLGPKAALVISAPALLVGNLHRAWMYRRFLKTRFAGLVIVGALPGSIAGGLLAVQTPAWLLNTVLLLMTGWAVLQALGRASWRPHRVLLVPVSACVGVVSATTGAGLVISPILLGYGLRGRALASTASAIAVSLYCGRLLGFGLGGMWAANMAADVLILTIALIVGNWAGRHLRRWLGEQRANGTTYAALALSVALALAGVAQHAAAHTVETVAADTNLARPAPR